MTTQTTQTALTQLIERLHRVTLECAAEFPAGSPANEYFSGKASAFAEVVELLDQAELPR